MQKSTYIPGILIIFLLLAFCPSLSAQDLAHAKRHSRLTYVFKLSNEQMKAIYKKASPYKVITKGLTLPVDSFCTDSLQQRIRLFRSLKPGHYAVVHVNDLHLDYSIKSISSFQVFLYRENKTQLLHIVDKQTHTAASNATVTLNGKQIPYDSNTRGYNLPLVKNRKTIVVDLPDERNFISLHPDYGYNPGLWMRLRSWIYQLRYQRNDRNGYMAFNKPEYLPHDTVKLKVFITDKKGRPLKEEIRLDLTQSGREHEVLQTWTLKPATGGAYVHEFVVGDSLQLDYSYQMRASSEKNHTQLVSNWFRLQDYQLDETSYELRASSDDYAHKDTVVLYASGKDANSFALQDARLELDVKAGTVEEFSGSRLFVPDLIWRHSQALDPSGETKIVIPDSVLPKAKLDLKIHALFNNSNNESHDTTFTISYANRNKWLDIKLNGPELLAGYFVDGKPTSGNAWMTTTGKGREETKTVQLPYKTLLDPLVEVYAFKTDSLSEDLRVSSTDDSISLSGNRSHDSVHICLKNPRKLDIAYGIYKGKIKVTEGSAKELSWKAGDASDNDYILNYHYLWGGERNDRRETFSLPDKRLNVTVSQPAVVYPGEKAQVKIKVTDAKARPAANVDLTALAVSNQFNISNIPEMDHFSRNYKKRTRQPRTNMLWSNEYFLSGHISIPEAWMHRAGLDTMPYYRLLYPANGIHYNYDSISLAHAEVSPFLMDKGIQEPADIVYIDNQPVYYYDAANARDYVFATTPGKHALKIRTCNKLYCIDSIFLKGGVKTDLSIDVNHLPSTVRVLKKSAVLGVPEKNALINSVYCFSGGSRNTTFVWQNDHICILPQRETYGLFKLCGFFPDSVHYAVQNNFQQKFELEPGYIYTVKKSLVKMQSYAMFNKKVKLSRYPPSNEIGLKAPRPKDLVLKTNSPLLKNFLTKNPTLTREGNGTYSSYYTGDSIIACTMIAECRNDTSARFYSSGRTRKFYDLKPGCYRIFFLTEQGYYARLDSVNVIADGTAFRRFGNEQFKGRLNADSLTMKHLEMRLALKNNFSLTDLKHAGNIKIMLRDESSGEPLPFAIVTIYKNGVELTGSVTDMNGEAMIALPAGRYDVESASIGSSPVMWKDVLVETHHTTVARMNLSSEGVRLDEVETISYYDMKSVRSARASLQSIAVSSYGNDRFLDDGPEPKRYKLTRYNNDRYLVDADARDGETIDRKIYDTLKIQNGALSLAESDGSSKAEEKQFHLRNKFSDYAYWQPDLRTDEKGEAAFAVSFPDNVTTWNAYVLAMNGHKQSGTGRAQSNAYKNILASLSTPRFLVEGDSASVTGKALNRTGTPLQLATSLVVNGKPSSAKKALVKEIDVQTLPISAVSGDSIKVLFSVDQLNGPKDAEERSIPVYPKGSEEVKGYFAALDRDTTITIELGEGRSEIYAQSNAPDFILKELDQLQNYPYACMEQTASKLNAYLMEQEIRAVLHQKFTHAKEIRSLLRKLEKSQKHNGAWGWWENSQENVWMTTYVLHAVLKAQMLDHSFKGSREAINYLEQALPILTGNELVSALNVLSEARLEIPYAAYLNKLEKENLSFEQKLTLLHLKQENKLNYNLDVLDKEKKTTLLGNYYWGSESSDWYDNSTNATLTAYQVLRFKDSADNRLPKIRDYFLEIKQQNKWRNTVETARILETILPPMAQAGLAQGSPELKIDGGLNEAVNRFPYKRTVNDAGTIRVTKKGSGSIYFTAYQKRWNSSPEKKEDHFSVAAFYERNNKRTDTLRSGQPIDMVIEVSVKKLSDYVMIEVPIPAGCSYDKETVNTAYPEVHRESFKNKTNIFCELLKPGKYTFRIKLQPRYTGVYTVNPASVGSMYFPTFYGRNSLGSVKIR